MLVELIEIYRRRPFQGCRMDLRVSYERKTVRLKGPLHHENVEMLTKIKFEDMNLYSKARGISWAERGSHRIEKMMVYDRKTEFIKMSKNDFFYFGPGVTQDPWGPHKTLSNLKIKKSNFLFLPPPGVS